MRSTEKRLLLCLVFALFALTGFGQEQTYDLREPVTKITFGDWQQQEDADRWREFTASFPSAFVSAYPTNNQVPLRAILPKEEDKVFPVVLILHYWGAKDIKVERAMADRLAQQGIASVILTLPYHLARSPEGFRSGELAIQPDPEQLRATMIQSVLDVKRALDFIETRRELDSTRIGIVGTSLGALVSSLSYGVEPRLTHAAFVLGGADVAEIVWKSSLLVEPRESLRRQGYTFTRLQSELLPVEPLTYLQSRKQSSALVIGGRYDTVVPPSATRSLISAFDSPKVLWIDTGHYGGIFVQSRILKEVANYFASEFNGKEYVPPKRIFVPTLRVGVQASAPGGFDIGVGIDLWKSGERGGFLGTALLTPRGPQLFLGARLSPGLSFGVVGGSNRIGIGLFWSRVL